MSKSIDFDAVAGWYDLYVQADFDQPFWVEQARRHPGRRLELMCGTGRLSMPILRAGLELTCVDHSAGLLAVFREKLAAAGLDAELLQRDVRALDLSGFDYGFIGFHSFSELVEDDDQRAALESIRRAVRPGGSLIVSLHEPAPRAPFLDGTPRELGPFPLPGGGTLAVEGRYALDRATGIVTGSQRYREQRPGGCRRELELPVRFRLVEPEALEAAAAEVGFTPVARWGDYAGGPYRPRESSFFICELA